MGKRALFCSVTVDTNTKIIITWEKLENKQFSGKNSLEN